MRVVLQFQICSSQQQQKNNIKNETLMIVYMKMSDGSLKCV